MRGSITRVSRKDGFGRILAEDGNEVYFDKSGVGSNGVDDLRVGHWVEFELQYGFERRRAVNIKRLRPDEGKRPAAPIARRRRKAMHSSVTKILRKLGCGFVLTESGDEAFFGSYALDGIGIDDLEEGQWVDFELYDLEMGRRTCVRNRFETIRLVSTDNA